MREALLLELILAAIDEGVVEDERDLVRLYTWLVAATQRQRAARRRQSTSDTPHALSRDSL